MPRALAAFLTAGACALLVAGGGMAPRGPSAAICRVFDFGEGQGLPLVLPLRATDAERAAADLVRETLAAASGLPASRFPLLPEGWLAPAVALRIGGPVPGATEPAPAPPRDNGVGYSVDARGLRLGAERPEIMVAAASWFLERETDARWFHPGPLGREVPRRARLSLQPGVRTFRPDFVHRDLGVEPTPAELAWRAANRLEARFEHGHNLTTIFRPEDFRRRPELAPERRGWKHFPAPGEDNWQPDLRHPAVVEHAAAFAIRAFDREPSRLSISLSVNDTIRYDDSAGTLAAVAPLRHFRGRPDYAPLVFRFTNAVARRVAEKHPDRWLPAYAYYWCEDAPPFPVERNVVPFLTADRSQWSHPEFERDDRDLIERWCRAGAAFVGVYDYFYGRPFLVPRPTLPAVARSIPFHHRAGVRAFYAEAHPNWAIDGPKAWLAAQLLWEPTRDPAALLDLYFAEYWREAAAPMRAFFAEADRVWEAQPGPPFWLRHYRDDDQTGIFPPAARALLAGHLRAAAALASTPRVRARVAFAAAGLGVSEAFARVGETRGAVSRLAVPGAEPARLAAAWCEAKEAERVFRAAYARIRREHPLALAAQDLTPYLRTETDGRVARLLAATSEGRALLAGGAGRSAVGDAVTAEEILLLPTEGREALRDAGWEQVVVTRPVASPAVIEWTAHDNAWGGFGEPWETRQVTFVRAPDGRRVLRLAGCIRDDLTQWVPAAAGEVYEAAAEVRARVSPGTSVHLLLRFMDERGRFLDPGRVDRVPAGAGEQALWLTLIGRAPPGTRWAGMAVRALNQVNDDFAEFTGASLRRLPAPSASSGRVLGP